MFNFLSSSIYGYIIVVVVIVSICILCWLARKKFKICTYTKEEEKNMKSNLDLLIQEEDIDENKDYTDEV